MTENTRVQRRASKKKNLKPFIKWGLITLLGLFIAFASIFTYYGLKAPKINQQILQQAGSSTFYSSNNKPLFTLGNEERDYVSINKVPQKLQDAVISIEDHRFYNEPLGIDPIRIVTTAFDNVTSNSIQGGGSTLTQQLVKLSVFSTNKSDQTIKRKMQEIWLAVQVEQKFSKKQILEFYMNKVYLSNGVYGVKTASKYYFGKSLNELTLPQLALIAGMPQSPSTYDPYLHPQAAKNRRDNVLRAMYDNKKITKHDMTEAIKTPIDTGLVAKSNQAGSDEKRLVSDPYLKEAIKEVKKKGYDPYRDNLKITTNMDYGAQKKLYDIVNTNNSVYFPNDQLQVASTVVNPKTGQIVAMIGGRKLGNVQLGYNRAVQTSRSNGSTMKPILDYGPAFEYLKWSTAQTVRDTPYTYPGTNIPLNNWDNTYKGTISVRTALATSRNIPAVRTLNEVGFSKAITFARKLGIDVSYKDGLSAGIGYDTSTLQNAGAYSAFANGGYYRKPYYVKKIELSDGTTHSYSSPAKKVMKSSTAYMITDILKGVVRPSGMGSKAYVSGIYHAGKTGTTNYSKEELQNNPSLSGLARDAWFNGYTKDYVISTWTGYDKPSQQGLPYSQQTIDQSIYKYLMSYLSQDKESSDWEQPGDLTKVGGELYFTGTEPVYQAPAEDNSEVVPNKDEDVEEETTTTTESTTTDNSGGDGQDNNQNNNNNNNNNNGNNNPGN
ncbi:PBP1A family penicillin-binding protein [Lactobacillus sp. YT155]|uniref:transglycosylase domain-containing protein n=1 Tax=Lactobacillus sp. YT155 TaxID=3060955 RepID=UPI00265DD722|nr:PBP1A family penicillin-binding protein [Lactobacillus sp. YT155]MDO1605434.1 PBP1A family penicillin-binding protein [Lactobacillus sp. YT155]